MSELLKSKLVIDPGNPAVRIEVVDSNFQICARGYGRIEEELPTGFYTVRYRAGDALEESNINLEPGHMLELKQSPTLEFGSVAPFEQSRTSVEHQTQAQELSKTPQVKVGAESEFFVFVRDLMPGGKGSPAQGLSLHRLDGTLLVDFGRQAVKAQDAQSPLWAGCNVELDPDRYLLRLEYRSGLATETLIVACPNWQSQFFLLRQPEEKTGLSDARDLSTATQFMARRGRGFRAERVPSGETDLESLSANADLAELAQLALAHEWRGMRTSDLTKLLKGKHYDPLLGIFGLHLLFMRSEPDLEFADHVVERLERDILNGFRHPDVEALKIEIQRRQKRQVAEQVLATPPMLYRSWLMNLQATAENPALIPYDSFPSRIANRLWGNGAWLTWVTPSTKRGGPDDQIQWPSTEYRPVSSLRSLIDNLTGSLPNLDPRRFWQRSQNAAPAWSPESLVRKDDFQQLRREMETFLPAIEGLFASYNGLEGLVKKAGLDRSEVALLSLLHVNQQIASVQPGALPADAMSLEALVSSLGMPADRIQIAMVGLLEKLSPLVQK
jgi:hypothetical protein